MSRERKRAIVRSMPSITLMAITFQKPVRHRIGGNNNRIALKNTLFLPYFFHKTTSVATDISPK
jgi:hypothetical protein